MGEDIPEKPQPPLCIRLGFYSKKAWIAILVFLPLADFAYPAFVAEDPVRLLEDSLPIIVFFMLLTVILFAAGNWAIMQIRKLFGIDFRSREQPFRRDAHLEALFEGDSFKQFQTSSYKEFMGLEMPIIAFILSAMLVFVGLIYPALTETDRMMSNHPEIYEDELYYAYFAFRIVPLGIYMLWFLFSGLGGLLLLLEVVFSFHSLARFPGLSLYQAKKYIVPEEGKKEAIDFSHRGEIVKFSLKRFKRRSKGIPDFLLRVNIIIAMALAIIGLFVFFFVSAMEDDQTRLTVGIVASGVIIFIVLVNILLFLFPQVALHLQLEKARNGMIESLEELYELKKFQYLQLVASTAREDKELLWLEMQALDHLIEELESLLTWPFNYPQLLTLMGGSLLALIPVAIQAILGLG